MTKPEHIGLLVLGVIVASICIFAGGTLTWRGRVALVLLTLATLFVWIEPEATGAAVVRFRTRATRALRNMR